MEDGLIAKVLGVISGAFLALTLDPPRSRMGFARRVSSSIVFGWIFGGQVLVIMNWSPSYDNTIAAFCVSAFVSWAAMGRIKRFIESYKKDG